MVKNIIFDMGQVLIRWRPDMLLDQYALTAADRQMLMYELFQSVEWIQQDHGILTEDQVLEGVLPRLPEHLHAIASDLEHNWYRNYLWPIPGMAGLVKELKEAGYGIYLLSNANMALRSYFPNIPGSEYFDGLMVSAEEKMVKPQKEIYERLYERFDLNPAECVFIDDNPANIEGSIYAGMPGIIFRGDVARLRRELGRMGVNCGVNA